MTGETHPPGQFGANRNFVLTICKPCCLHGFAYTACNVSLCLRVMRVYSAHTRKKAYSVSKMTSAAAAVDGEVSVMRSSDSP